MRKFAELDRSHLRALADALESVAPGHAVVLASPVPAALRGVAAWVAQRGGALRVFGGDEPTDLETVVSDSSALVVFAAGLPAEGVARALAAADAARIPAFVIDPSRGAAPPSVRPFVIAEPEEWVLASLGALLGVLDSPAAAPQTREPWP